MHICDSGHLCRYYDIYPMYSVPFNALLSFCVNLTVAAVNFV